MFTNTFINVLACDIAPSGLTEIFLQRLGGLKKIVHFIYGLRNVFVEISFGEGNTVSFQPQLSPVVFFEK